MTADNFVVLEGDINILNLEERYIIIADRAGAAIGRFTWPKATDYKMAKQKVGYYVKAVCEKRIEKGQEDKVINCLVDFPWADRPADWPKPGRRSGGGNRPWTPADPLVQKQITYNGILNSAVTTVLGSKAAGTWNPDDIRKKVLETQKVYLELLDEYLKDGKITLAWVQDPQGKPLSQIINADQQQGQKK